MCLLENVRFYKEEEKCDNSFSKKLAAPFDMYVNDAFGTAHRSVASPCVSSRACIDHAMYALILMHAHPQTCKCMPCGKYFRVWRLVRVPGHSYRYRACLSPDTLGHEDAARSEPFLLGRVLYGGGAEYSNECSEQWLGCVVWYRVHL